LDPDLHVTGSIFRFDDDSQPGSPNLADRLDRLPTPTLLPPSASEPSSSPALPQPADREFIQPLLSTAEPAGHQLPSAIAWDRQTPLSAGPPAAPQPDASASQADLRVVPPAGRPPLQLRDLIATVKSTKSTAIEAETSRLLNNHTVNMHPEQLYNYLYVLYGFRRNLGRCMREFVTSHRSAGISGDALVDLQMSIYADFAEDDCDL